VFQFTVQLLTALRSAINYSDANSQMCAEIKHALFF